MAIKPYPQYIEADDVAEIDAELALNRGDTCVIQRKSSSQDAGGAPASGGYSPVGDPVSCQIAASGRAAVERIFGGEFGPETDYVIKMPRDTSLTSDDQIVVNGTTMQIVSDDSQKSYGFELLVAAKATE